MRKVRLALQPRFRQNEPALNISKGLRLLGYVEGQNVTLGVPIAEGKVDRFPELTDELVGLKVDVIIAGGGELVARAAAKQIGVTIPQSVLLSQSGQGGSSEEVDYHNCPFPLLHPALPGMRHCN